MDFYQSIGRFYDDIFPLNQKQVDFTCQQAGMGKLLDVGCATGSLAIALDGKGYEVEAFDIDPGMVKLAQQKEGAENVSFRVADMLSMDDVFAASSFTGIICYGNTLVHLPGKKSIGAFFSSAHRLLQKDGKLMFQVLNYETILAKHTKELPLIDNEKIRFERYYNFLASGFIEFITRLTVKEQALLFENWVELYPVTRSELSVLLQEAGFSAIQFFGGFDQSNLSTNSLPLVGVALKE